MSPSPAEGRARHSAKRLLLERRQDDGVIQTVTVVNVLFKAAQGADASATAGAGSSR